MLIADSHYLSYDLKKMYCVRHSYHFLWPKTRRVGGRTCSTPQRNPPCSQDTLPAFLHANPPPLQRHFTRLPISQPACLTSHLPQWDTSPASLYTCTNWDLYLCFCLAPKKSTKHLCTQVEIKLWWRRQWLHQNLIPGSFTFGLHSFVFCKDVV